MIHHYELVFLLFTVTFPLILMLELNSINELNTLLAFEHKYIQYTKYEFNESEGYSTHLSFTITLLIFKVA